MIRHPWQIWSLFGLCLAMVLPAMIWLTHKAVQLDRAEALAQQHAELEEIIGSALWQMDTELTGLLAVEIARPPSFFQAASSAPEETGASPARGSTLGHQPSPYVRLHFELHPDGSWSSPQCPGPRHVQAAGVSATARESTDRSRQWLSDLAGSVRYEQLLDHLPQQQLESHAFAQDIGATSGNAGLLPVQNKLFQHPLDLPVARQPLDAAPGDWPDGQADAWGPLPAGAERSPHTLARNQRFQQRRSNELWNRDEALQAAAQQALVQNTLHPSWALPEEPDAIGVSQPVWIGTRLLLARRVETAGQTVIQGCWLDWPKIRAALLEGIRPVLPDADLEPVVDLQQVQFHRVLAALPVQLVTSELTPVAAAWSPIRVSLWIAWAFLALATVAVAALMRGVVSLSERRAAFVSAVTHELRTPLTTFRLYAEMLAEGMVEGEAQRALYLQTLKDEAERLAQLVENVLQYARLERGAYGTRRETVSLDLLMRRIEPRLQDRAGRAAMTVVVESEDAHRSIPIATDPAAVEQILFNLVDNACKYAQAAEDRRIHCRLDADRRQVSFEIWDHGPGLSKMAKRHLFRPFCKSAQVAADTAPGVGLGLALSRRLAVQLGGRLEAGRSKRPGASFTLSLPRLAAP
jgi:signal transduction histidine kinase